MKLQRLLLTGLAAALFTAANTSLAFAKERVYIALSKDARGQAASKVLKKYECPTPFGAKPMLKATAKMELEVIPHAPCDEYPVKGKITASWLIYVRNDAGAVHFGTHSGPFTWMDTDGNVWKGVMHGTIGCGTHRPPLFDEHCEECRAPNHFEGCLSGRAIAGPLFERYKSAGLRAPLIEATYAGFYEGHLSETITGIRMTIDGVHVLSCP